MAQQMNAPAYYPSAAIYLRLSVRRSLPAKQKAACIIMPNANIEGMQHRFVVISATAEQGCHALVIVYKHPGYGHSLQYITLLPLPPYSPELNPVEQSWQQLRRSHFSSRCFEVYELIVDACCQAWNVFEAAPERIKSLCTRS